MMALNVRLQAEIQDGFKRVNLLNSLKKRVQATNAHTAEGVQSRVLVLYMDLNGSLSMKEVAGAGPSD
jgi:hypothetical protein